MTTDRSTTTVTVVVTEEGGTLELPALPTPVAGLAIADATAHHVIDDFGVVHTRSGATLASFTGPELAARYVLDVVEPLGIDWTLSGAELHATVDEPTVGYLQHTAEELGGYIGGGQATAQHLSR